MGNEFHAGLGIPAAPSSRNRQAYLDSLQRCLFDNKNRKHL
ncbi:hypothetical protein ACFVYJ_00180 [Pontibacter sp. JAM-7]